MKLVKSIAGVSLCLLGLSVMHAHGVDPAPATVFSEAILQTHEKLSRDPYATSSPHAERLTNDFIAGLIGSAWRLSHHARHLNAPVFSRGDEFVGLPGLFNPDNIYSNALIEDTGRYRITGTRGNHVHMSLQFIDSFPLIGLSEDLLVIDFEKYGIHSGDAFELFIGGPRRDGLWWPMPGGAQAILARQTFNDWEKESPTTLHITRLDAGSEIPEGVDRLSLAARYLQQITAIWSDHYLARLRRLPVNAMGGLVESKDEDGGLSGQQTAMARFLLNDDEALVITAKLSNAAYQGVQLGNYWYSSPNPVLHQSSLNASQAHINSDGYIRYIVSLEDPGFVNWLDPAGSREGHILMRWQGLETSLSRSEQPVAQIVPLDDLAEYLPKDSPVLTAEERRAQIRARTSFPWLKR